MRRLRPCGIITPLITPFDDNEEVDLPGLRRLIDRVLAAGVNAVFALGTSGEFVSLSETERQLIMEKAVEFAGGRSPVWIGVASCSTRLSTNEARRAVAAGADGIVLLAPYYYPLTEDEIEAHVSDVRSAVDLPLLLYQNPRVGCGTILSIDLVERLSQLPGVVGIKDSAKDIDDFKQRLRRFRGTEFALLQGDESLLGESLLTGASGGVCSLSNAYPRLLTQLFRSHVPGLPDGAADQWAAQMKIAYETYFVGPSLVASLKAATAMQGVCGARARKPFQPLTATQQARLQAIVQYLAPVERADPLPLAHRVSVSTTAAIEPRKKSVGAAPPRP